MWGPAFAVMGTVALSAVSAAWMVRGAIGDLKVEVRELAQAFRDHLEHHPPASRYGANVDGVRRTARR